MTRSHQSWMIFARLRLTNTKSYRRSLGLCWTFGFPSDLDEDFSAACDSCDFGDAARRVCEVRLIGVAPWGDREEAVNHVRFCRRTIAQRAFYVLPASYRCVHILPLLSSLLSPPPTRTQISLLIRRFVQQVSPSADSNGGVRRLEHLVV
jgi:hypothetical protein